MSIITEAESLGLDAMPGGGIAQLALKAAPWLLGLAVVIALGLGFRHWENGIKRDAMAAQQTADKAAFTQAQQAAAIADQRHADAVHAADQAEAQQKDQDNAKALDDARAHLAAYEQRMRAPSAAARRGGGDADLPAAAAAAGGAQRSDPDPLIPASAADLDACAEAVTRLGTVRDWYATEQGRPR
jgi:hypothetical protein